MFAIIKDNWAYWFTLNLILNPSSIFDASSCSFWPGYAHRRLAATHITWHDAHRDAMRCGAKVRPLFREQSRRNHEETSREPDGSLVQASPLRYASITRLKPAVHSEDRRPTGWLFLDRDSSFFFLPLFLLSFTRYLPRDAGRRKPLKSDSLFRFRALLDWLLELSASISSSLDDCVKFSDLFEFKRS